MFRALRTVAALGAALTVVGTVALTDPPAAAALSPGPSITSFTPPAATVGTVVTISGSGFTDATSVAFNQIVASITSDSDSQITTTVPLGQDSGLITVSTPGGTATSSTVFTLEGFYVATSSLPDAQRGYDYRLQLQSAGGTGRERWSHTGVLPKGMTMTTTGLISGVPNLKKDSPGSYPLTVRVVDLAKHDRQVATESLSLDLT
jgi:hypothetical protein